VSMLLPVSRQPTTTRYAKVETGLPSAAAGSPNLVKMGSADRLAG
jgi:hypothetical protein